MQRVKKDCSHGYVKEKVIPSLPTQNKKLKPDYKLSCGYHWPKCLDMYMLLGVTVVLVKIVVVDISVPEFINRKETDNKRAMMALDRSPEKTLTNC